MELFLFRVALRLYPSEFRVEFGDDMLQLLRDRLREAPGRLGRYRALTAALLDLFSDSVRERSGRGSRSTGVSDNHGCEPNHSPLKPARQMLENLLQDLRFAVRALRKAPTYTVIAVTTLALGIGANTAIFSVVRSVLLVPLSYPDQDRIISIWNADNTSDLSDFSQPTWLSEPEVLDYRETAAFEELAVYDYGNAIITGDGEPVRLTAGIVEAGALRILGVQPALGRWFTDEENQPGNNTTLLLGYQLWQNRYGGDADVVGRSIVVNGRPRTVVGVMPADFRLPLDFTTDEAAQLFVPMELDRTDPGSRGSHYLFGIGRLARGSTVDQATAQLEAITTRLTEEGEYNPDRGFRAFALPIRKQIVGNVEPVMMVLLGAVGFVLLIACTNVANLTLARTQSRSREFALRNALGATTSRLFGQQLVESLVLASFGGIAGVLVALGSLNAVVALNPQNIPRFAGVSVDSSVLAFNAAITLATGLLFGILPALHGTRPDPVVHLKEGGRGAGTGRHSERLRRFLVVSQLAFAVLLATGGALMVRSFWNLLRVDSGFQTRHVMTMQVYLPSADYPDDEGVIRFYQNLLARLRATRGIEAVGLARNIPLNEEIGTWSITAENAEEPFNAGEWQVVSAGYHEALGIQLQRGRFLFDSDTEGQPPVVVVNELLAGALWPNEDPVGKRFRMGSGENGRPFMTVVGVVGNVRHNDLASRAEPKFYVPFDQWVASSGASARRGMYVVARTEANPLALVVSVRQNLSELDPNLTLARIQTYDDIRSRAVSVSRLVTALLVGFAALALTIAAVGVYGVMSYSVLQRVPEIGVRMALGATSGEVVRMIVRQGVVVALVGVLIGGVGAMFLVRFLGSMLYEVSALDPVTFALVPVALIAVAFGASLIPALRAAGIQPTEALRYE